jgi:hypothetical protein
VTVYENAVSITSKQGYRLSMGPVLSPPAREPRGWRRTYFGSQWRATLENGWGPPCWHQSVEAAIDCLDGKISQVFKP